MRIVPVLVLTLLALSVGEAPRLAEAERANASPAQLQEGATHVLLGTVKAVYTRTATQGGWRVTRYVAEVEVVKSEKGNLAKGQLAYVRYWQRSWIKRTPQPPSASGHHGIPKEGETLRIYAVNKGDNRLGRTTDGGLDVIGPNGFVRPAKGR